jgi:monovalent cation:H+ antiporter-2, CPA2 family
MLGLEYSGEQLKESLSRELPTGVVDFVLNFPPGLAVGILLGWNIVAAVLLGGVTWISSSGLIAKVLTELNRLQAPETPVVLSILVLEDLAMAVYLPLIAVLLAGGGAAKLALFGTGGDRNGSYGPGSLHAMDWHSAAWRRTSRMRSCC